MTYVDYMSQYKSSTFLFILCVSLYPMDNLTCLGCLKAFTTQKSLSNHEAQCDVRKSLDSDVYKQQRCLEKQRCQKNKRKHTHGESASPKGRDASCGPHRPSPSLAEQMDVDIIDNDQWFDAYEVCHMKCMIDWSN